MNSTFQTRHQDEKGCQIARRTNEDSAWHNDNEYP